MSITLQICFRIAHFKFKLLLLWQHYNSIRNFNKIISYGLSLQLVLDLCSIIL